MRLTAAYVGFLAGALAATAGARAQELPRVRIPVSLQFGWDTPLGTGGLTVGAETAGGWGMGAGIGFNDAIPGTLHTLVALNLRAPIVRRGSFDLGALLWLSAGGRETQKDRPSPGFNASFIRWQWQTAYRLDVAASARFHRGAWGVRLDAGVGYILNAPHCEYTDGTGDVYLADGDCADPLIPAAENATSPWVRVTPFVSLAGEYDIASAFTGATSGAPTREQTPAGAATPIAPTADGRESNAWLAPTALTLGQGKVRLSAYEGIVPELAVGVTDRLQVSGTFGILGDPILYKVELKLALVTKGRLRLALLAGGLGAQSDPDFAVGLWGGGGVASLCLDAACRSMASVAVLAGLLVEDGSSNRSGAALISPSLVVALGPRAKLVVEIHTTNELRGAFAVALLRLPFRHLGVELGVLSADRELLPAGTLSWTF